jgi:hypothetical protein
MTRRFPDMHIQQPRPWSWIDTVIVGVSVTIGAVVILAIGLLMLMLG